MTISRVKFPWPPFFRIFIFFDEVFNFVCGTTYLMRDDGATVVNVRSSRVICSFPNPTDLSEETLRTFWPSPVHLLGVRRRQGRRQAQCVIWSWCEYVTTISWMALSV